MSGIVGTSHSKSKVVGRSDDLVKAWAHFDGSAGAPEEGFGVASCTTDGSGLFTITLNSGVMANEHWAVASMAHAGAEYALTSRQNDGGAMTSTVVKIHCTNHVGGAFSVSELSLICCGN